MNILLKSATIVDTSSKHHLKKMDILIENGKISRIARSIPKTEKVTEITLKNLHVSQGWFDSSVSFGEPGYEERETIDNGLKAAAYSGFTHVAVNANTNPVTDTKSAIKYLKAKGQGNPVNLYPVGALSNKSEGIEMAELYDMKNEGAISFYDYKAPIENANLLKIGLQYAQNFNGLIQSFPFERSIAKYGMVNEEINSTRLGLKGIPAVAEELQIIRDLYLLEYTGGKLHIPTISTKKSVNLIKEAKKKGLNVSCSVAISNLFLTDEALESFDTNYKLMPPLRTQEDIKALIKGLKEGIIDGITSDHDPVDIEHKKTEFDHSNYGSIGLESCFGATNKLLGFEMAVNSLTRLKDRFQIGTISIEEGNRADLSLFDPNLHWEFTEKDILSKSKNSALLNCELLGKAYGIYANKKLIIKE